MQMKKDPFNKMFPQLLKRRELLGFLGGTVGFSMVGGLRGLSQPVAAQVTPSCVVKPEQTEGPYFVDEKLHRSDLRSDPSDGSVRPGLPLWLAFQVSETNGSACQPLRGAIVDVWHCDALGVYSDVADPRFSTLGKKFLRGYQVTNVNGIVRFLTIYPGWYSGRTVHIHFKIRTNLASGRSSEFTSQLYFDDAVTDQVYAQSPYAAKGQRTVRNNQDGIFQDGGEQLLLPLTKYARGYMAKFAIGLSNS
jgi:protocatechuate 3,4-dioxygenase beta subunit